MAISDGISDGSSRIRLVLPESPALNAMIGFAKRRTRRSRTGGWMRRSLPVVYDQRLERYELECLAAIRTAGMSPPATPWSKWRLESAHFRLHALRDPIELLASLKWPVDVLVRLGFVAGDSPRELLDTPKPTQEINRQHRSITLTIAEVTG